MKICIVLFALFCVAVGENDTNTTLSPSASSIATTALLTTSSDSVIVTSKLPATSAVSTELPPTTAASTAEPATTAPPSTAEPATTAPPHPDWESTNKYTYTDSNGTICLLAKFAAHFKADKKTWNVSEEATVDNDTSSCGKLSVFFGKNKFEMDFSQTTKDAFYLSAVNARLVDGAKSVITPSKGNLTLAKASNGSSYMCLSGLTISMSHNVTLYLTEFQLQAYYVKDAKFATAYECTGDFPGNMLVPIIVGCALGGLIVVVLLAYCILRSRANRKYDPVDNTI